ncbi:MAG: polysaccharide biosynthesis/export family protein [Bacteroidia bacterium]|nr:polysaccharide biosynthesis/export family protein [Bacteroidia bacterium]MCF8428424.1 polysaccharide biosynthesis/export family protein [Bacteroidia bacterium]
MFRIKIVLSLLLLSIFLSSCVSNKKFVYLQDKGNTKVDSSGLLPVIPYEYKLQKGDVLYIALTTEDEKLNRVFVPATTGTMNIQSQNISGTMLYYIGFTLSSDGSIELPYLGKLNLAGKSLEEAKMTVEKELRKYFKTFFLQMKLADFKFSVLGYVNKPGQYIYNQNKVTLPEAIAQAGELNNLANRYQLQLYRQYPDGVKVHVLDLTDQSIINSPYWYVQPNDVLYVVPLKKRTIGDLSSLQSSFGVVAPLLSALLLVLNTYILVKNL